MGVIAIIAALLLEQWRPLGDLKAYFAWLARITAWIEQSFNASDGRNGAIAWAVAVVPPVAAALALHALFYWASPLLALLFNIGVLYLTLGFRQFSHTFTELQGAIKGGDLERAQELIAGWRGEPALPRSRDEVIRLTVEEAILAAHRHVFGVLLWYVVLPGPSGAVLYRLAAFLCRRWGALGPFGRFAEHAFYVLEWGAPGSTRMPACCSRRPRAPWARVSVTQCKWPAAPRREPSSASAQARIFRCSTPPLGCCGARWWFG
jgi:adenosylcobinamide-phosphate synthase